jgi:hypothetical protein
MTRKKRIELVLVRHRRSQISYLVNMKGRKRKKSALKKTMGFLDIHRKRKAERFCFYSAGIASVAGLASTIRVILFTTSFSTSKFQTISGMFTRRNKPPVIIVSTVVTAKFCIHFPMPTSTTKLFGSPVTSMLIARVAVSISLRMSSFLAWITWPFDVLTI